MSWSLELRNGDFHVQGPGLGTVTRERKLIQDIKCAILERMGTDNLHPEYGSIIDGGVSPDGVRYPSVIGESDLDLALLEIQTELSRIGRAIQQTQLARAKNDKAIYGSATLEPHEVLIQLGPLDFVRNMDSLRVTIHLTTATDSTFDLELPIDIPIT